MSLISRVSFYVRNNGLKKAAGNAFVHVKRWMHRKIHIFYINLDQFEIKIRLPENYRVILRESIDQIRSDELDSITRSKDLETFLKNAKRRFAKGAKFWILMVGNEMVGYEWTVEQFPISGYFFPLPQKTVHVFDIEIFSEYRGNAYASVLTSNVLQDERSRGMLYGSLSIAGWNNASIKSMTKMNFREMGVAKRYRIGRRTVVIWSRMNWDPS